MPPGPAPRVHGSMDPAARCAHTGWMTDRHRPTTTRRLLVAGVGATLVSLSTLAAGSAAAAAPRASSTVVPAVRSSLADARLPGATTPRAVAPHTVAPHVAAPHTVPTRAGSCSVAMMDDL